MADSAISPEGRTMLAQGRDDELGLAGSDVLAILAAQQDQLDALTATLVALQGQLDELHRRSPASRARP